MAKPHGLYDERFKLSYWAGYVEGERNAIDGSESSSKDGLDPRCSTELLS